MIRRKTVRTPNNKSAQTFNLSKTVAEEAFLPAAIGYIALFGDAVFRWITAANYPITRHMSFFSIGDGLAHFLGCIIIM
jgi:hypothetical protein